MRRASLLAVFVVLAAAGCGSNQAHDYVEGFNAVIADLQGQSLGDPGDLPSDTEDAAALARKLQESYDSAADRLDELDPPDDVAEMNDLLVTELRGIAHRLGKLAGAFASGDPQQVQAALRNQDAITTARNRFNRLVDDINQQLHD
jgi:hypothetical protein